VKRYQVKLLQRAKREYTIANTWWRTNRQAAPNLLRDELRAVRDLLAVTPEAGRVDNRGADIRRLPLPATRYIVFYRVDHAKAEVQIAALWHASREAPEL
jgi:plasmid stabilization system protein ParE